MQGQINNFFFKPTGFRNWLCSCNAHLGLLGTKCCALAHIPWLCCKEQKCPEKEFSLTQCCKIFTSSVSKSIYMTLYLEKTNICHECSWLTDETYTQTPLNNPYFFPRRHKLENMFFSLPQPHAHEKGKHCKISCLFKTVAVQQEDGIVMLPSCSSLLLEKNNHKRCLKRQS